MLIVNINIYFSLKYNYINISSYFLILYNLKSKKIFSNLIVQSIFNIKINLIIV